MKEIYDLDIATEILARMQAKKRGELKNTIDPSQRTLLQREMNILRDEAEALYNNLTQQSIINKAFEIYGPILKAETLEYAAI